MTKHKPEVKSERPIGRLLFVFLVVAFAVGGITTLVYNGRGALGGFSFQSISMPSWFAKKVDTLQATKRSETSYVDPRDVLSQMKKGQEDFVLIDIRQDALYKEKYIKGSTNVPFSTEKMEDFADAVKKSAGNKQVIILPYSHFSTTGELAAQKLTEAGVNAHLMNIGANELFNLPNMWLPENEWQTFKFDELVEYAD